MSSRKDLEKELLRIILDYAYLIDFDRVDPGYNSDISSDYPNKIYDIIRKLGGNLL